MKIKYLIQFILLIPFTLLSQKEQTIKLPFDSTTNKITYKEVIYLNSISEDKLFSFSKKFLANIHKSDIVPVKIENIENHMIISNGSFNIPFVFVSTWDVVFSLTIECKAGRVRIIISDFKLY
ncbi:MAG: DUF4468 domain-containing protein, partial [Saprospiraceae bacterium]